MRFDIITIFPKIFDSYFNESIIWRAQKKKKIKIKIHNLRDWTDDRRKTVDDRPYGGGPGMVLKIEPIFKAVQSLKSKIKNPAPKGRGSPNIIGRQKSKVRIILFSTRGKKFDQKIARRLSKYDQLILICGHYEGVDERVAKYIADEEISIGDFILTGGELPAMVLVDAVCRHLPGVLNKEESLEEKRGSYPTYTRPEVFEHKGKKLKVPKVLLSGNHKKIEEWRGKGGL